MKLIKWGINLCQKVYRTKEEVLARGREAIGVPFKDIDKSNKLKEVKGGAGKMIEEDWFGIKNNNMAAPDFAEAGVELKVTPYFKNSKGLRAKERLVCNIINYETENLEDFYKSSYWKKNETTLLMSYRDRIPEINAERKKEKKASLSAEEKYELKKQFTIDEVALFKIPEKDLKIIKNDWMIIANKIRNNKAHEISESDTRYLAACTKGSTAEKSLRRQRDVNAVKARERAYSLKPSYMTYILNSYIYGEDIDENIIKDYENIDSVDLESYIRNKLKPYFGKSQAEMKKELGIDSNAKSLNQLLISKALSVSDIENSSEFKKADIKVKTIRVECDGNNIEQHMSFPFVKFMDLINEEWEESSTKENMIDKTYMFVIFKKDNMYNQDKNNSKYTQEHLFLNNIMFWQISEKDAIEVKKVWEKAREVIRNGAGLRKKARGQGFIMKNDLPKSKDNRVAHMRPHTSESGYTANSPYADILPSGEYMTKQCFWFNRKFILEQIRKNIL
ncbi:Sau3AI family type II restriction endonuclease [Clostridium beijerinckii]|uniref:Sau3AI family type II restriction endonuclease n=1 Tax=Clostridium beijerinckii TaxID=1520 RepID=UPI00156D6C05|nr:Sau3AI family type II restriction endonuclease [Clostridium beijerinckii]NRW86284.1 DNA mismatch repair protein MutH [Clostridium beijerinckii]